MSFPWLHLNIPNNNSTIECNDCFVFAVDEFDFVCLEDCHQETHFPLSSFVDEARSRRKNVTQFGEAINYFCEILTLYTKSLFNFHSIFVAQKPIRFPTWTKNPAAMSAFCCTHSHSRIKAKCVTSESVIRKWTQHVNDEMEAEAHRDTG